MIIRLYEESDKFSWNGYVSAHPEATPWHLIEWKDIFEKSYGHKPYYFLATDETGKISGALPLFHIKSLLFGNSLTSMPFLDGGGVLGDDEDVKMELLNEAMKQGRKLRVKFLELRMIGYQAWAQPREHREVQNSIAQRIGSPSWSVDYEKVRMLLPLPHDPKVLMNSFKSKLRSQIRKPIKEGCVSVMGDMELLDEFYRVFSVNMRDLGSPVHSKKLFALVLQLFPNTSKICLVRKDDKTLAGSILIGNRDTLANPWASSLRQYGRLSPNMLLYWSVLKYACENGYSRFDFGRSTPGEGTYMFKEQWGARPYQLSWVRAELNGKAIRTTSQQKSIFSKMIEYWKHLPVALTLLLGPPLRRQISL